MNALVAQQVDVSAGSEPTNLLRMARAPLRPLTVIYEGRNYIKLSARADLGSAKDIKTFGVIPGTVSQYCAGLTIQQLGLDPAAITIVNSGPPELPAFWRVVISTDFLHGSPGLRRRWPKARK